MVIHLPLRYLRDIGPLRQWREGRIGEKALPAWPKQYDKRNRPSKSVFHMEVNVHDQE